MYLVNCHRNYRNYINILVTAGLLAFLVVACAPSPKAFEDFCKKENRKISKEERVVGALNFIHEHKEALVQSGESPNAHFFKFVEKKKISNDKSSIASISSEYYHRYPDCCRLLDPWPIRAGHSDAWAVLGKSPAYSARTKFIWVYEIHIANEYPFTKQFLDSNDPLRRISISVKSGDCGRTKFINWG